MGSKEGTGNDRVSVRQRRARAHLRASAEDG